MRLGIPFCVGHNRRSSPAMLDAHRIFRQHMTHPKTCPWRWRREGDLFPSSRRWHSLRFCADQR